MSLVVRETGGGSFEMPPTGVHQGVCAKIFDLGEQPGFEGKIQDKIALVWQLSEKRTEGDFAGEPFTMTKTYTASLNERATLRHDLESWRGRGFTDQELQGFDVENVLGVNCMMNLVEYKNKAGKKRVKIASIMPVGKGVELLVPTLPDDYMPKWVREALGEAEPERKEYVDTDDFEDDVPF